MAKLTYDKFNELSPEALSNYTDEEVYKAAVAAKKVNSGKIRSVK